MKVILTERVQSLGNVGEIVKVSAGFARNFLLPKKVAVPMDERNKRQLDEQKKRLAKKVQEEIERANGVKGQIDGLTLEFTKRVGGNGRLFGTVTTQEISNALQEKKGVEVEKRVLQVDVPIKSVGTFGVKAKLFQDVVANFTVKIIMDPKQVEENKLKEVEAKKAKKVAAEKAQTEAEAAKAEAEAEEQVES